MFFVWGKTLLQGSVNHVSITVSDLPGALKFFTPLLEFLGYVCEGIIRDNFSGQELVVHLNPANGTAVNIWQAKPEMANHKFEVYEPGLHHLAFNVEKHDYVDEVHDLVKGMGATILDGPGEFPFGPGGYYAVYFLGPDNLKFEIVHMPLAEQRFRALQGD
jgi:glyoxylase I family protein